MAPIVHTPVPPVAATPTGPVAKPRFHALFWDNDWDAHYPAAPTQRQWTQAIGDLIASGYFAPAGQYGVTSASSDDSGEHDGASNVCGAQQAGPHVNAADVFAWVTCEVGANPALPGAPAITGVPQADENSVYVVFLPPNTTSDAGCGSGGYTGYHAFSAAPRLVVDLLTPLKAQTFPYVVIPTSCGGSGPVSQQLEAVMPALSHEMMEAATDPYIYLGWFDNTTKENFDLGKFFYSTLAHGEVADICNGATLVRTVAGGVRRTIVEQYWSNVDNACVPM